ncbi:cytochrome c oxidase subunit 4 [Leifsonia sp. H3M29-4]|uniref:cytochrome c oxidase subunit 4 n=1 Tax=Salinibacterium metalliresistens TaxID=3031321 RepID=UPI0023D9B128|nr:cytochrome c oxidase subunit 4 [Salinibacterium metalliresistens]MDF1480192.1 cytochrome c oxidase subunit 4 [Salinibacterium metalliresistens]
MGTNAKLFWILAGFFFLADAIYITWSLLASSNPAGGTAPTIEWAGTIAIGLSGALAVLVAFYLQRIYRSQGAELPEDRLDANVDDGDAEQGHFSPWSWWPLVLAASSALLFLGIAIGAWIAFIGAGFVIVALVGWVFEYYRGNFGH